MPASSVTSKLHTVVVSEETNELFLDYEQAVLKLAGVNPENQEAVEVAHQNLCWRRKDIYEHLEDLEKIAERKRTVIKRF